MTVTETQVRKATMRLTLSLDGDTYYNQHQCVEFPELTRVDSGPSSRQATGREPLGPHTKTYFVAGVPVERSVSAVTAAINEHRKEKP